MTALIAARTRRRELLMKVDIFLPLVLPARNWPLPKGYAQGLTGLQHPEYLKWASQILIKMRQFLPEKATS
jgi:hypothetical protein